MSKIKVLSESTINKIAAGEVIENPASVVKELVENSIDAGASEICIEIKGGGRQLIRITDNGCGMSQDDALLCLERHATSKIQNVEDIHEIYTMGFRGEAIPSIASISKFTLITSDKDNAGTMLVVEGGKILQCTPAVRSKGTTIEIKSLFFNVPVRKKFQRSPAYDSNEIQKMVSNIALAYPYIQFQLISEQKSLFSTTAAHSTFEDALKQRIIEILGNEFIEQSLYVESSNDRCSCSLKGFVGNPSYTRNNRTGQFLLLNQRPVFSPVISYAVKEGFGTMLPANRHPVYVLHLNLPGIYVDVNVHPQKREVRLREEQILKEMIIEAIRKVHQHSPSMPLFATVDEPIDFSAVFKEKEIKEEETLKIDLPSVSVFPTVMIRPAPPLKETQTTLTLRSATVPRVIATIKEFAIIDAASLEKSGIGIIDQKAAHARIVFERLQKQVKESSQMAIQTLLIPYTFEMAPLEAIALIKHLDGLNKLGIGIRQSGPSSFLIDAIPEIFGNTDFPALVAGILEDLREDGDRNFMIKEQEKRIAMAVSRSSGSYSKRLSNEEAQMLVNQLMQCDSPYQCPQGKTTMIFLSQEEIVKKFTFCKE